MTKRELFFANLRGEHTERTPVWIMRQAGRCLPGYRKVRESVSFEQLCRNPKLVAEVTSEPIEQFGLDAAIIFSDILLILEPLGIDLAYNPGPVISPPLETPQQFTGYAYYDPSAKLRFVGDAIVETKSRLGPDLPLLGFCGAPFTLFSYLCNTTERRDLHRVYRFLTRYPDESRKLLQLFAELSVGYLRMQFDAGVDAVQIFDTWAGELSEEEFATWSYPYLKTIVDEIHKDNAAVSIYIRGIYHLLNKIKELNADIISIDWKTPLTRAAEILRPRTLQGNMNPNLMLAPGEIVVQKANEILESMKEYSGYIFNLGHGLLPMTPVENVRALVETVHAFRRN
ncbi:MAG: uroporphyrinogen decarboxylase [Candidatus Zixiibacteriota bacterium]|nr:MAG: uroporphyrinogen decarboxylase [candidate division Zixibacteria bacterium]